MDIANITKTTYQIPKVLLSTKDTLTIAYIQGKNTDIRVDERVFHAKGGDIAIIMPNTTREYILTDATLILYDIERDMFGDFVDEYIDKVANNIVISSGCDLPSIIDNAISIYEVKSIIYHILYIYTINSEFSPKNEKLSVFIKLVTAYIDNNFDKEPTIDALAEYVGYVTHYVSSLITSTFGVPFLTLVNEKRIEKAKALLKETDKTMSEIAILSGYSVVRSFNRNFVDIVKMTPVEYRESYKTK